MTKPQLTIASGNPNKVAEIKVMLGPLPINVHLQPSHLDVEETGSTYQENAFRKAHAAATITNNWAIADDSGLEVDCLNGKPGVHSSRYSKEGTAESNLKKLLNK